MGAFLALALTILSQTVPDPLAALDAAIAAAEHALRDGTLQVAESHYRSVLVQAWMMAGTLDLVERRQPEARDAFRRASTAAGETGGAAIEPPQAAPFAKLQPAERLEIRRRVTTALARAYLNLGVMQAQAGRYARAAELLEDAAHVDAAFPQVQYSLGVAYFNAQRYTQAVAPLSRALDADPDNAMLRRMLAIACLNTDVTRKPALLAFDPGRDADPSLQYARLALGAASRRRAEPIFSRLFEHAGTPELSVVLATRTRSRATTMRRSTPCAARCGSTTTSPTRTARSG
jgi:tetratricopeptide (TPR) repeat protein